MFDNALNTSSTIDRDIIYTKCFLSLGLGLQDFKIENNTILFRMNKFDLIENFICDLKKNPK